MKVKPLNIGIALLLIAAFLTLPLPASVGASSSPAQEFRVVEVFLQADPPKYDGPCPVMIKFSGYIKAEGQGTVKYTFMRNDGATAPTFTVDFAGSGTQPIETTWTLGDASLLPHYEGWQTAKTLSPNELESSRAAGSFVINCGKGKVSTPNTTDPSEMKDPRLLSFSVDPSLKPAVAQLPMPAGQDQLTNKQLPAQEMRPVATVVGPGNVRADFVENELILLSDDRKALDQFLQRWNGKLLMSSSPRDLNLKMPDIHLVRIDASNADTNSLTDDLRKVTKEGGGPHTVSSQAGLQLLAAAAKESVNGLKVSINWLLEPADFMSRTTTEAATGLSGGWDTNAYMWPYMNTGSPQNIGVGEAWRELARARQLRNRVKLAVVDGGFVRHADTPAGDVIGNIGGGLGTPNPYLCGGSPCPWHGTNVVDAAMGLVDNRSGAAGSAGPVAEAVMVQLPTPDIFFLINAISNAIRGAAERPRIVNISYGGGIPAALAVIPGSALNLFTSTLRGSGVLIFASAGNNGQDVDAEDSFGPVRWENAWFMPCENEGVICVGGMNVNSPTRAGGSNFGSRFGQEPGSVDIFGPFTVFVSDDPGTTLPGGVTTASQSVSGTSFSSPFVAGIAALIIAANPSLSADRVERILLDTAHRGGSGQVPLWPDARAAVCRALPGGCPPEVSTPAPTASSGRFRITINGFTCNHHTLDDAAQRDGVDDEIFVRADLSLYDRSTNRNQPGAESRVMGDSNGRPDRIRAGSGHNIFGGNGGFKDGDSFPTTTPWLRTVAPQGDRPPLFVWEGQLARDDNALVLIPSIWEWDDGPTTLHDTEWTRSIANTWTSISSDVQRIIARRGGSDPGSIRASLRTLFNNVALGKSLLGPFFGGPTHRPVGMDDRGDRYGYQPEALVLTYDAADRIARTVTPGRGAGIIQLNFTDHPDLQGNYTLFIQVERVP